MRDPQTNPMPVDLEKLKKSYARTKSGVKTAKELNLGLSQVYSTLKKAGVKRGRSGGPSRDGLTLEGRIKKLRPLVEKGTVTSLREAATVWKVETREGALRILRRGFKKGLLPEITEELKNKSGGFIQAWGGALGSGEKLQNNFLVMLAGKGNFKKLSGVLGCERRALYRDVDKNFRQCGFLPVKAKARSAIAQKRFLLALVAQMKGLAKEIHPDALPNASLKGYYKLVLECAADKRHYPTGRAQARCSCAGGELCRLFGLQPMKGRSTGPKGKWFLALQEFVAGQLDAGRTLPWLLCEALARPVLKEHLGELENIQAALKAAGKLAVPLDQCH